jgi:starvation-inducible DNA-binding protein
MQQTKHELEAHRLAAHTKSTDIASESVREISVVLTALLADVFALYIKTKNFHWHMSGPSFRDYHLLLDEQGDQLFGMTDDIAERVRKIGGTTLRSIAHIARIKRIVDNDAHGSSMRSPATETDTAAGNAIDTECAQLAHS